MGLVVVTLTRGSSTMLVTVAPGHRGVAAIAIGTLTLGWTLSAFASSGLSKSGAGGSAERRSSIDAEQRLVGAADDRIGERVAVHFRGGDGEDRVPFSECSPWQPVMTGGSLTGVTVMLAAAVAALKALVPPLLVVSAVPPARCRRSGPQARGT